MIAAVKENRPGTVTSGVHHSKKPAVDSQYLPIAQHHLGNALYSKQ